MLILIPVVSKKVTPSVIPKIVIHNMKTKLHVELGWKIHQLID